MQGQEMSPWSILKAVVLVGVLVVGPLGFQSSHHPLAETSLRTALTFAMVMVPIVVVAVVGLVSLQMSMRNIPPEALGPFEWNRSWLDRSNPLELYEFSGYGLLALGLGYVLSQLKNGLDENCIVPLFIGVGLLLGVRAARLLLGRKQTKTR
jgi:hypothetical protein